MNLLKEAQMRKTLFGFAGMGFLLGALIFAVAPVRAQSVDEKIQNLEQELSQLKSQQIEMKKDAAAAAAALPSFSYRPGNGMNIEAADKSWGLRASFESHFRMEFLSGDPHKGRTNAEIMGRRFRPTFFYCINNCLWEIEAGLDLDGWGTGNAWDKNGTKSTSILQRGAIHWHAEQLNPWLPSVDFGMDVSTTISSMRQGSSAIGSQGEYDLLSRKVGPNTGRAGTAIVLNWDNRSLGAIGIPGRISRFQFAVGKISEAEDGRPSFTDKMGFNTYLGVQPFSQVKNKWIRGLTLEYGVWFCNPDISTANSATATNGNGCSALSLSDHGDSTVSIFSGGSYGKGLFTYMMPGLGWEVGPYRLRVVGGFMEAADQGGDPGKKRANNFLIGHDLFLWSPKGFLTGNANTTGSILFGTHFERNNAACEGTRCPSLNSGQFKSERILIREWDLWYFMAPRMSVGVNWLWYDANHLVSGKGKAGNTLGVFSDTCGSACTGKGGNWHTVWLNWRYTF
jgi:hypothetical protein